MEINLSNLQDVFNETFDDCPTLTLETTKEDIDSWDSINHLNLILELEDRFDVELTTEEIESLDTVQKIMDVLQSK